MKKGKEEEPKVQRIPVGGEIETVVFAPDIPSGFNSIQKTRPGFATITTRIVKVVGEQRTQVVPGLAGDVVTEIKIK